MIYSTGSLVKTRGREWVVLSDSNEDFLVLRPIGGGDEEITGVVIGLESVEPATFSLPSPDHPGDARSARLLRDSVRLGFRSSTGPFRSFASLGFDPRSYQLVPLLMALKLDPIRLLIADDVGIGKTLESGLIVKEMLDRGEIQRFAVLCPPPLAEQWHEELLTKFNLDAELVLPSTVTSLERGLGVNESLFERYPFVIVSLDYIKSDRHRESFLRACPEFVIVDEAHTCAFGAERGGKHQRHRLIDDLARDQSRHMIFVTATPHSGKEEAFRSLLEFINPEFADLPEDLSGTANEKIRRELARYFIQRRRADILRYLGEETTFPERVEEEFQYKLSPEYRRLFDQALEYARETIRDAEGEARHVRIRWWSALALLRSLASSPAAAADTLRNRAAVADAETEEDVDEIGRRTVLDQIEDESVEGADASPGAHLYTDDSSAERRRLLQLARQAEDLKGAKDNKLQVAKAKIKDLVEQGHHLIVFCRYITTAEYLAEELRKVLPKGVEVAAITGLLPPAERVNRVKTLAESPRRVLVATDCLSEGINLQDYFDSVMHYDLSWNPTRHEQREGRVDRFGQKDPTIKVITYYGSDNQIDGVVLEVLIRKYQQIRKTLGISVPLPGDTNAIIEALLKGYLLRGTTPLKDGALLLPGMEDFFGVQEKAALEGWDRNAEREKRTRSVFNQVSIKTDEVERELKAAREAVGAGVDLEKFTRSALTAFGARFTGVDGGALKVDLSEASSTLKDGFSRVLGRKYDDKQISISFNPSSGGEYLHLTRTHPFLETLASHVLSVALDPDSGDASRFQSARRCGAIRTTAVDTRTTLLVTRYRYQLISKRKGGAETPLLAEECLLHAFTGSPQNPVWLEENSLLGLLDAESKANITAEQARDFIREVEDGLQFLLPALEETAARRSTVLQDTHQRVRVESKDKSMQFHVEPQLPPDILGIFIYLPAPRQ